MHINIAPNLGPVIQNVVSLTLSLSPQFVNYISTSKANTVLFFVEKMCNAKDSRIFSTKNNSVFVILPFEITNNIVNFEQLAPGVFCFNLF